MSEEKRKLYEVKISFTYYAYTETPDAACDFAREALDDAWASDYSDAQKVTHKDWPIEWSKDGLVYHAGRGDIVLGDLLDKLPESVKAYKKEER